MKGPYVARATATLLTAFCVSTTLAQVVDFETLPDGAPTFEGQTIHDQYEAVFGVTFTLLDRDSGLPIGYPKIAKTGEPYVAFLGCSDWDTPLPGQGLGETFLTEGVTHELPNDLLIEYAVPVSHASGVLIDVDLHDGGTYEEWTVTALDGGGAVIGDPVVITAPNGPDNPACINPYAGPGDGLAVGWQFSFPTSQISGVRLHYTGTFAEGPVAFDNFSPGEDFSCPEVFVLSDSWNKLCCGDSVELIADVVGGMPPFTYQWQEETSPDVWIDLGTDPTQIVSPTQTTSYRVIVTDANECEATSDPFELTVCDGNADLNCDGKVDMVDFGQFQAEFTGP